ncbi:MAG: hypothetical protein H6953_03850 [Chromatiaceae bacterium]|nr:hypothetical protein [Gammaproteobacteria bacterium]MCP5304559.1 hypothetical protein [Chromatiaceae bacterium]MCP5314286.1 hypothetical protein [Chromatiaceae bacterium]
MKAFAHWVMKGRMQAVIAASVLAMLGLLVTPAVLLSAAVIMLTVLRQGWREGLLVLASALLAIAGLGGLVFQMPIALAVLGAMLWVPAAVLGGILGKTGSLRLAIEIASIGAGLIVLAQYASLGDPAAFWSDALNAFLSLRIDAETLANADLGPLVELMAGWMAGGVAATWLLGNVLSLSLARYWSALLDRPGAFGDEFRALRFGRWLLILVPALLVFGVILTGGRPNLVGQLYLVGMVVFLIQGLSFAHWLVAEFSGSGAWIVGLYLLLILVAPQSATMVALAGYADGWLDFRTRVRARRPGAGGK